MYSESVINPLRIRLSRIRCLGTPKREPIFHINIANARDARDGKVVERVGRYESAPDLDGIKHMQLDFDRIKFWLAKGAQPSERVARILGIAGILPTAPRHLGMQEQEN